MSSLARKPHLEGTQWCSRVGCANQLTRDQRYKKQRYCSRECMRADPAWVAAHAEATAAHNRERWKEWKAKGIDPAHGGEAAKKRGAKIAESDRRKPRRRKG